MVVDFLVNRVYNCSRMSFIEYNFNPFLGKPMHDCFVCGKPTNMRYCNDICRTKAEDIIVLEKWLNGTLNPLNKQLVIKSFIRDVLKRTSGNKCSRCGWKEVNPKTNKVPLHIHHIDGDFRNNKYDNLSVLCPNCHSLTENYGSLNMGKGRTSRREL